jgi:hypothetical protein
VGNILKQVDYEKRNIKQGREFHHHSPYRCTQYFLYAKLRDEIKTEERKN